MDIFALWGTYGYWALAVAIILADVPTVILAGYLIARSAGNPILIILSLAAGRLCLEAVLFKLGRYQLKEHEPKSGPLKKLLSKGESLIARYPSHILLSYHFIFGAKLAVPIASGASPIGAKRFYSLNTIGFLIWLTVGLALGYQVIHLSQ